ncbi:acyl carrier protein phosphodiesterase [Flavobacterium sp. 90]|uniref:acyl carrier protein phosphodiesterase n=1 Tax=unclassified Flavobacterium TaxID=196869 RepID=UPI000EB42115|nr:MULTISPECIES: ACP phosphodiesterase [unclassified Flavobacterium]RKR12006.1 acyl carrier protein phosphodiesterase [Flavobacterium sp. 81]TCK55778.1 acyl carrier protein phosphodiesterase [Flavobacterium sp. 90]
MNFLAHIYLSGDNDLIKIGNFMADGIRGKQFEHFPEDVQKGIILHRFIDTYTDSHDIFRQSTKRLHEKYHHYAGVIVDIVYDHFLAKNWAKYSDEKLDLFINRFYKSLHENYPILTERTQNLMPTMIRENWLWSYQTTDGIQHILTQMDRRSKNQSKMQFATQELKDFYAEFESEFDLFFQDMQAQAKQKRLSL